MSWKSLNPSGAGRRRPTTRSRRRFVQTVATAGAGAVAGASAFPSPAEHPLLATLGLQLHTVREPLATRPQQTVEAIQQAGYRQVELSDARLLPRLQPVFRGLGIDIRSAHFPSPLLTGNWEPLLATGQSPPSADDTFEKVVAQAAQYGLEYLVFPFVFPQDRGDLDTYRTLADKLNQTGEVCRQAGIQLVYHHHAFEFQPMEATTPFQVLLEHTDPALMHLEIDVFWASVAGLDPAQFILEQGQRNRLVPLLHLMDKKPGLAPAFRDATLPPDAFLPVGDGELDFPKIIRAAEAVGVKYCFVKQDVSPDPLADIARSSEHLKNLFH